jgi:hypothetical protein
MTTTNFERQMEAKHTRRLKAELKTDARLTRLENKAEAMIGELAGGKCYIFPVGGKYREGTKIELLEFLIRNKYVR